MMSRPERRRSRLAPVLIVLLIAALAGAAVWFFLLQSPEGLADTELTGFLPRDAVITANGTDKKTQTVEYTYDSEHAYCDAAVSARLTFRYEDGSWTPDGQEEVLSEDEDWSRLKGTWTDEAEPDLTIVVQDFRQGAMAGTVTYTDGKSGMFDDLFAAGKKEADGTYQFTGKGALSGTYLRIGRDSGLLFNNLDVPMEKDAPVKPSPTPSRTLEIDRDGATETVDTAATPTPAPARTLVATAALNVRPEPNTDKDPLGTVDAGTVLTYMDALDGWYQVSYEGLIGYVSASYIQDLSGTEAGTVSLLTATAAVNVRSGPGTGYQVLTTVDADAKMVAVGLSGGWYQIRYNAGYGYVSASYVTQEKALN